MKIIMILIVLFLFSLAGFGQTWQVVQQSPSVMLVDLCMLPDGQNGWAVGGTSMSNSSLSTVLHTTNGGANWQQAPFSAATSCVLQGVFFATPDSGWVVGANGAVYFTADSGATWSPQSSGTNRLLARVQFINSREGWIGGGWQDGSSYLVLHTTNGGFSWQNISFGANAYSTESVFFHDSLNGWIGGRDNTLAPHIHHTSDGGVSWTRQDPNIGTSNIGIASINFVTAAKGWAAVTSIYVTGPVLYTEDGGTTWTTQFTTGLHYHVLDVRDSLHVAVVGTRILSPAQTSVFSTSDGGLHWSSHNPPIAAYTYGIQYRGSSIYLTSDQSAILISPDSGTTWHFEYRAPLLRSIGWNTHNNGWVIAGTSAGTDGYCSRSPDAGETWAADSIAPGGAKVQWVDSTNGWMLKEGNNSAVWRTTDGGTSWTQHFIGTTSWIGGIFFATPDSGWAFGSNGTIRATTNGGVSWHAQSAGTTNYVEGLHFINSQEGWAGGGYGGSSGFILHTANGGATWTPQTPALGNHVWDVFFLDSQYGWASTVGGQLEKTTDGGASWLEGGQVNNDYAEKLYMISPLTGWLTARNSQQTGGQGFIYRTDDGGDGWTLEWTGDWPNSALMDLAPQPGNVLWACGNHNTILSYAMPQLTTTPLHPRAPSYVLYSNSPNPFNSRTVIAYTLPHAGPVTLEIYDLLGRRVTTLISETQPAGTHQIAWNAGNVASGIYLYRVQSGNWSDAKKMVLIR